MFSTALDLAIQNYEELPLTFAMARAPASGCGFTINAVIDPDTIEHVITHELGHTIGFRHTVYYNRSISCGSGGNEGDAGLTGGDATALLALHPKAPTTFSFRTATGHYLVAEDGGGAYLAANHTAIGPWERFIYSDVNGGELRHNDIINLRVNNGSFVVAEGSGGGGAGSVNANRSAIGPWETFVITLQ